MNTVIDYITNTKPCIMYDCVYGESNVSNETIVLAVCIHNGAKYVHGVFANIRQIVKCFKEYKILIYLNNCTDKTHALIQTQIETKRLTETESIIEPKNVIIVGQNKQTENNAYCRNVLLQLVNIHYSNYDYYMVMDLDENTSNPIDIDAFMNCFKLQNDWGMITPYTTSFNVSALRGYSLNYDYNDYINHIQRTYKQQITDRLVWLLYTQHERHELENDKMVYVASAFNSLAVYKMKYIRNCIYDNVSRWCTFHNQLCNKMCVQHINEHVTFHQQMITRNKSQNYIFTSFKLG